MKHLAGWRGLCAAALFGLAGPAHAYFDNFLSNTIVGTLNKDQVAELRTTFSKTLSESADGTRVPFQLAPDARGRTTDGAFTPLKTKDEKGQRCRKIRSEFRQQGRQPERWTAWYCQQPGGDWKKNTAIKD